ncbi:secondary thiamine-phosphate synthase enzyme YjbQ [Oceanithermus sp.]|uniref:secondary thiamine-phosphate synthase enzyme YjbQ n=1 Tax=Oceanithermus sp. TaxID=2268145 RepID=UPI0025E242D8|nr:secondary thiamine-phosphate synthase enzyme YjbQ [Oceanithermus sp.]
MERFEVRTTAFNQMVRITPQVEAAARALGVVEGAVLVYSPHTTAGIVVQEGADPDVAHDLLLRLAELAPRRHPGDRHAEGNSDAHLKTALVGNAQVVPVSGGRLALGTWQQVFLAEFDGPRTRQVWVTVVGV